MRGFSAPTIDVHAKPYYIMNNKYRVYVLIMSTYCHYYFIRRTRSSGTKIVHVTRFSDLLLRRSLSSSSLFTNATYEDINHTREQTVFRERVFRFFLGKFRGNNYVLCSIPMTAADFREIFRARAPVEKFSLKTNR